MSLQDFLTHLRTIPVYLWMEQRRLQSFVHNEHLSTEIREGLETYKDALPSFVEEELSYWRTHLHAAPTRYALPLAAATTAQRPAYIKALYDMELFSSVGEATRRFCEHEQVAPFSLIMALWQILLYRYTDASDIVVGSFSRSLRSEPTEWQSNMVPLRVVLSGELSLREVIALVDAEVRDVSEHISIPFDVILQDLCGDAPHTNDQLFNTICLFRREHDPIVKEQGDWQFKGDFCLIVQETERGLQGTCEYNSEVLPSYAVERIANHFQVLLESFIADPDQSIATVPILTAEERHLLLHEWNGKAAPFSFEKSLIQLFEEQVARTPEQLAVLYQKREGACEQCTYRELNAKAESLAWQLLAVGVTPRAAVGVYAERSLQTYIALLAILKARGIYVPLSLAYPVEQVAYVMHETSMVVLLTEKALRETLVFPVPEGEQQIPILCIDGEWEEPQAAEGVIMTQGSLDDPVLILFTSGSTGRPKGVIHQQYQLLNRFQWLWSSYPFQANDRICQRTALTFMPSLWELLGGLLQGITTIMLADMLVKDPRRFLQALVEHKITSVMLVPTLLKLLLKTDRDIAQDMADVRMMVLGGEPLSQELYHTIRSMLPHVILINDFGATEVNGVLFCDSQRSDRQLPGLRPIANVEVYIVDRYLQLVPVGVTGELHIGGRPLALGYLNHPELTRERFIAHPFSDEPGARLYKMGDCAYYLPDGSIKGAGRRDHQVKIRGMRVEMAGVEQVLVHAPNVQECVVVAQEMGTGDKRQVAYLVFAGNSSATALDELQIYVEQALPDYMRPSTYVMLPQIPRLANGKPDRYGLMQRQESLSTSTAGLESTSTTPISPSAEALAPTLSLESDAPSVAASETAVLLDVVPAEAEKVSITPAGQLHRVHTKDEIVSLLLKQIADMLQVPLAELLPHKKFYALGIDSISVVELARRLEQVLNISIAVTDLYDHATPSDLAEYLQPRVAQVILPAVIAEEQMRIPPSEHQTPETAPEQVSVQHQEIAIIGMAGRFPGADDVSAFWDNLSAGLSSIREVPPERWDLAQYYDPDPLLANHTNSKWGGFLSDIKGFDPLFFGISRDEAAMMDPQQRLCLEESWKALEDAGYGEQDLSGKLMGVFVGARQGDYRDVIRQNQHTANAYTLMGNDSAILAARISYYLNLQGPNISLDTACSSSLIAIHLACQSIRSGECEVALAGGVSVMSTADLYITSSKLGMLSPEGQCKTFDEHANGFVPGECVGFVVLKPLLQAVHDHDHIYGVIKGSAMNQDGKTNGITAPSVQSQRRLEELVYKTNNILPETISYVEAHGTGTKLGDPIEIRALTEAFRAWTDRQQFCAIGSVKTNIGHTVAGAGVAGIIKILQSFAHKTLPPSLNFTALNEHINLQDSPFYISTQCQPWEILTGTLRRAALSSFGFSGTNCHMVLEEAPVRTREAPQYVPPYFLIALSARTEYSLHRRLSDLECWLSSQPATILEDLAYTLMLRRSHFSLRCAFVVRDSADLLRQLRAYAQGESSLAVKQGNVRRVPTSTTEVDFGNTLLSALSAEQACPLELYSERLSRLAELFTQGYVLDWKRLYIERDIRCLSLPLYAFEHEVCWAAAPPSSVNAEIVPGATTSARHDIGLRSGSIHPFLKTPSEGVFSTCFTGSASYVVDHVYQGQQLIPGMVLAELARAAGEVLLQDPVVALQQLLWLQPAVVEQNATLTLYTTVRATSEGGSCEISSESPTGQRIIHSRVKLVMGRAGESTLPILDLPKIYTRCIYEKYGQDCYTQFEQLGMHYGPTFQVLRHVRYSATEALGMLELATAATLDEYVLHPSLLDGALQTLGVLCYQSPDVQRADLPFAIEEVHILRPLSMHCLVYAKVEEDDKLHQGQTKKYTVQIADKDGQVCVLLKQVALKTPRDPQLGSRPSKRERIGGGIQLHKMYLPVALSGLTRMPTSLLVFFDDEEHLVALREALTPAVQKLLFVRFGYLYRQISPDLYEIDPQQPEHYQQLLADLAQRDWTPEAILLWPDNNSGNSPILLQQELDQCIRTMLSLVQACITVIPRQKMRLIYAYVSMPEQASPQQAALGGFLRSLQAEEPRIVGSVVEFCADRSIQASLLNPWSGLLASELATTGKVDLEVRYAGTERTTVTYQTLMLPERDRQHTVLRPHRTYIITGGGGGLGRIFAQYLAEQVPANLVLVGRSECNDNHREQMKMLSALGSQVIYCQTDIASREDVQALLATVKARFGNVHGVIHSAGVLRDTAVRKKTMQDVNAVLAPKVYGTKNLDELTASEPLDFFVLFSSVAAILGNHGQTDYAYANSFLDHFAIQREQLRRQGLRTGKTLSLNWPFWQNGGMQMSQPVQELMGTLMGFRPLATETGLEIFQQALLSAENQVIVLEGDVSKIKEVLDVKEEIMAISAVPMAHEEPQKQFDRHILALVHADMLQLALRILKARPEDIDFETEMSDFGLDSITMMEFVNLVNQKYTLKLTPTVFLEYITLGQLVQFLVSEQKRALLIYYRDRLPHPTQPLASPVDMLASAYIPVTVGVTSLPEGKSAENGNGYHIPTTPPIVLSVGQPSSQSVYPGQREPIAIIGMSGRFPGAADLEQYWQRLSSGSSAIREVPADRWDWRAYDGDAREVGNKTHVRWGGFIERISHFDASFFGISLREAALMDPQQRLFLQIVWQVIEDAGYKPSDLAETRTGLFVGAFTRDYAQLLTDHHIHEAHTTTGTDHSILANRISYFFHFHGPSEAVDTACSSSLVALHRAIQALHNDEAELAIVGGVNALLAPEGFIRSSKAGMLSESGQVKSFDKDADGYLRGEGVGALLLKPLSRAQADGDHIYALIRGSAVNHNGHSYSLTAPNPTAQAEVIVRTMERAGVLPEQIGYIEAHGTGTVMGDLAEINAFKKAFSQLTASHHSQDGPVIQPYCGLGSVKPNIGHLEAASGMAALIKVIMALQHRQMPPTINLENINPQIELEKSPFFFVRELQAWAPLYDRQGQALPRLAGVHSFGFGGTNAHVLLEENTALMHHQGLQSIQRDFDVPLLFVFSARTQVSLRASIRKISTWMQCQEQASWRAVAYTLQIGREAMEERVAFVATNKADCIAKCEAFLQARQGEPVAGTYTNRVETLDPDIQHVLRGTLGTQLIQTALNNHDIENLALLWVRGAVVDWRQLGQGVGFQRVSLPTYAFDEQRCWFTDFFTTVQPAPVIAQVPEVLSVVSLQAPPSRESKLLPAIRTLLSQILGQTPESLPLDIPLHTLGLDSIMTAQLKYRLETTLSVTIPMAQLSQQLCMRQLVTFLEQETHSQLAEGQSVDAESTRTSMMYPQVEACPQEREQPFPLTDLQESFLVGRFLHRQLDQVGCHFYCEFEEGDLDVSRLWQAWQRVLECHAMLLTVIHSDGSQQYRALPPNVHQTGAGLPWRVHDQRQATPKEAQKQIEQIRQRMSHRLYQAEQWPLWSIEITLLPGNRGWVHLSMDEWIIDAGSLDLVLHAWAACYNDPTYVFAPLELSFRDLVLAQKRFEGTPWFIRDQHYWQQKVRDLPAGPQLPVADAHYRTEMTVQEQGRRYLRRKRLQQRLEKSQWQQLKVQAETMGVSPTVLLLTVFSEVLAHWSDQERFSLIMTYFNRLPLAQGIEQLVGPLVSTNLFVRDASTMGSTLAQRAQLAQEQVWQDLDHSRVSGIRALREGRQQGQREQERTFPVVFTSMLHSVGQEEKVDGWWERAHYSITQTPQIWLDHQVLERAGALCYNWDVAEGIYAPGVLEGLHQIYYHVLVQLASNPTLWQHPQWWEQINFLPRALPQGQILVSSDPGYLALTDLQQAYLLQRQQAKLQGRQVTNCLFYQELSIPQVVPMRVQQAWEQLIRRHAFLRLRVGPTDELQILSQAPRWSLRVEDWRAASSDECQKHLALVRTQMQTYVFDPTQWPLFELRLTQLQEGETILHLSLDGMIADGPSICTLLQELSTQVHAPGQTLPPLQLSVQDYQAAVRSALTQEALHQSQRYWQQKLHHLPEGPRLHAAHWDRLPQVGTYQRLEQRFSPEQSQRLTQLAALHGLDAEMILLALYACLLAQHSAEEPFSLVVVRWERLAWQPQVNSLVGELSNLSWVQMPQASMPLVTLARDLQQQVRTDLLQLGVSGLYGMRTRVSTGSTPARWPVVFTGLLSEHQTQLPSGYRWDQGLSRTPGVVLDMVSRQEAGSLHICWDLRTDVWDLAQAQQLFQAYGASIQQLLDEPDAWTQIPARPAARPESISWEQLCVHEIFAQQAQRTPHAQAVGDGTQRLSYEQLDGRANQLAHSLQARGVGPDVLVGLCFERTTDLLVGLLAILKAGGAYVPLDPAYPRERLRFLIEDAQLSVVLTQHKHLGLLSGLPSRVLTLESLHEELTRQPSSVPSSGVQPEHLAYVIYTSGSTGQPKGVLISHHNITRLLSQTQKWFHFGPLDVWTLYHSYAFDFSVWEIWGALLYGGRLVVVPYTVSRSFEAFYRLLQDERVTVLNQTPTAFQQLMQVEERQGKASLALRYVIFGGEALDPRRLRGWFARHGEQEPQLVNMYGITETTVHVTYRRVRLSDCEQAESVIGEAIGDLELLVVDEHLQPAVEGELLVAGAGLARGYLRREELTRQRFIEHPSKPGERVYRSGDLVRRLSNGELCYLGRIDEQVKVRGFRIELGEIETILEGHASVKQAAVVVRQEPERGEAVLVAYLCEHRGEPRPSSGELRQYLRQQLPDYMVPNGFAWVEQIPLTVNGKRDRQALPWPLPRAEVAVQNSDQIPNVARHKQREQQRTIKYEQQRAGIEAVLCEILHIAKISPEDDIFNLGATSLTIVMLAQRIQERLGVLVPVEVWLNTPTLNGVMAHLMTDAQPELVDEYEVEQIQVSAEPAVESASIASFPARVEVDYGLEAYQRCMPQWTFETRSVSFRALSKMLGLLRKTIIDGKEKYLYASAGGKYAVQTYLSVREGGVDGLAAGIYYYHPEQHVLVQIVSQPIDDISIYASADREQAIHAGFALFLVGQLEALRPVYQDFSSVFATLDAGYLSQLLLGRQAEHGVGLRPVVHADFAAVREAMQLNAEHHIVHCLLAGNREALSESDHNAYQIAPALHFRHPASYLTSDDIMRMYSDMKYHQLSQDEVKQIEERKPHLRVVKTNDTLIALEDSIYPEQQYRWRASQRKYQPKPITRQALDGFLALLKPYQADGQKMYLYGSVGAAHGLNFYLYIKPHIVEGLHEGVYRYDPVHAYLELINDHLSLPLHHCHTPFNRAHCMAAGIYLFLVAELEQLKPQFGDAALHYAFIEAGAIGQCLLERQAELDLGLVPTGGMNFERLREDFRLSPNHFLIHSFMGGYLEHQPRPTSEQRLLRFTQQTAARQAESTQLDEHDIAVIGLAGRYPQARTLAAFWEHLKSGLDSISEVPSERWDHRSYYSPEVLEGAKTRSKWGGFIEDIDQFDPLFFQISPADAEYMDPQVRLALQTTWEVLEDAGYSPARLLRQVQDARVGVFVGSMYQHYHLHAQDEATQALLALQSYSSIANRISYFFNFRGPSMAVDTACSSALVSIHLACESIRKGECAVAVAGGVNLSLHPAKYIALDRIGLLSSEGQSKSFGQSDGFVPGEGVGTVLLKSAIQAQKDGDRIYCVIKASAMNHSGQTSAYSVPGAQGQGELIARTINQANVHPRTISYVEAAANGSPIGDAVEISALKHAFQQSTRDQHFCALGSVKSNIGHLEAASGIVQLTKVALQLYHRTLVPTLNAHPLNPLIDLEHSPFVLQEETQAWQRPQVELQGVLREYPRRAVVESFAAGGSNACLLVEEYTPPERVHASAKEDDTTPKLVLLSAQNEERLQAQMMALLHFLEQAGDMAPSLSDIAYTLLYGRAEMPERLALLVADKEELCARLRLLLTDKRDLSGVYSGRVGKAQHPLAVLDEEDVQGIIAKYVRQGRFMKLAELWVHGLSIVWQELVQLHQGRIVSLPTYAFARQRYWLPVSESAVSKPTPAVACTPVQRVLTVTGDEHNDHQEIQDKAYVQTYTNKDDLFQVITSLVAGILKIPAHEIDPHANLKHYGFTSLDMTRFVNRLSDLSNRKISLKACMQLSTLQECYDYLIKESALLQEERSQENTPYNEQLEHVLHSIARGQVTVEEAIYIDRNFIAMSQEG